MLQAQALLPVQPTYYYRVKAVGQNGDSDLSNIIAAIAKREKVWDGTNWMENNQVSTAPIATDKAVIEGDYNTTTAELSVGQLVINEGTFTIADGDNVTVADKVIIAENEIHIVAEGEEQQYGANEGDRVIVGPQMVIENNANLIQVNDVDNTGGFAKVDKLSAPMFRLDYAMWSSPVAGETLRGFSPETSTNRFYTYKPDTDTYTSSTTNDGNIPFAEGKGYLIRVANTHPAYVAPAAGAEEPAGIKWAGSFIGLLNNGNVNVAVVPQGAGVQGFNLVGNPYPSPINIHEFYNANTGSIDPLSALYFWRKKNDSDTDSYANVTKLAYTANQDNAWGDSSNGVFIGNQDEWVINPGQGFIVQATGSTIQFNNKMRKPVNNNQQFRNAQEPEQNEVSRLWLNMTGGQGIFSQAAIGYTNVTTNEADYGWDGRALTDGDVALFSYIGEEMISIQARAPFAATDVVPMGYKAANAGSYTISLDHVDGVFAQGQDIFLRDNVLGVTQNLNEGGYQFTTEAGTINGRFDVIYAQPLGNDVPVWSANSVIVYKDGGSIRINTGVEAMTSVAVYDTRGRMLYSGDNINATEAVINGLQAEKQVLIVNIATNKGDVSKKIIF
ncbi:T9SS sorting signal type C domain-containing protein [uncultured Flavobacterium sp.]|uniref:T9SS sorting signal type C domain-containing protein n=1 Tax=uncultured Flavobacterium sp. TaxID=165435 RepID=UPI0025F92F75|nr:T9SS sorting signal type C domain-containing protein [uncultured Flavobacterium sp.]